MTADIDDVVSSLEESTATIARLRRERDDALKLAEDATRDLIATAERCRRLVLARHDKVWAILDAFMALGEVGSSLALSGSAAADSLEAWADNRSLPVAREPMSAASYDGSTIRWTLVTVTVREHHYVTAGSDIDQAEVAQAEPAIAF